jgi:hypothetical protein
MSKRLVLGGSATVAAGLPRTRRSRPRTRALLFAVVVAALALPACAPSPSSHGKPSTAIVLRWERSPSGPVLAANDPPDSVLVHWTPSAISRREVREMADRHCLAWNRYAEPVSERVDGETALTEFACTPPRSRE